MNQTRFYRDYWVSPLAKIRQTSGVSWIPALDSYATKMVFQALILSILLPLAAVR